MIKLHKQSNNEPVLINPAHIVYVSTSSNRLPVSTTVYMSNGVGVDVRESIEAIESKFPRGN